MKRVIATRMWGPLASVQQFLQQFALPLDLTRRRAGKIKGYHFAQRLLESLAGAAKVPVDRVPVLLAEALRDLADGESLAEPQAQQVETTDGVSALSVRLLLLDARGFAHDAASPRAIERGRDRRVVVRYVIEIDVGDAASLVMPRTTGLQTSRDVARDAVEKRAPTVE